MSHPDPSRDYDDDFDCDNTDDGYDAAKDAWFDGGPAVTDWQHEEDRAWDEECRRNGW
jgi:hypothetical protein